jgi:hypothetical protein
MIEKLFWAAVGALIMRYIILNTPDYKAKEAAKLDEIWNKAHDLVKKYAPQADDTQVSQDVLATFPSKN